MFFKDRIDQLTSITGYKLNSFDRILSVQLESEIEDLKSDIEAKKQIMEYFVEQEEIFKTEYEAQVSLDKNSEESLKEEVKATKTKSSILATYLTVMYTDELPVNKLKAETDEYYKGFWYKLKPFTEKSRQIADELKKLKELQNKCLDLQQKANNAMAPAH